MSRRHSRPSSPFERSPLQPTEQAPPVSTHSGRAMTDDRDKWMSHILHSMIVDGHAPRLG